MKPLFLLLTLSVLIFGTANAQVEYDTGRAFEFHNPSIIPESNRIRALNGKQIKESSLVNEVFRQRCFMPGNYQKLNENLQLYAPDMDEEIFCSLLNRTHTILKETAIIEIFAICPCLHKRTSILKEGHCYLLHSFRVKLPTEKNNCDWCNIEKIVSSLTQN